MTDEDKDTCFLVVVTLGTLFVVALITWGKATTSWRDEAVDRGHAEYFLNAAHQREWRWKTNCVHDVWLNPPTGATARKP